MNKKGQFFMVAAAIIIMLALSLSFVYINTKSAPSTLRAENIASELKYESSVIVNRAILNGLEQPQINNLLNETFIKYSLEYFDTTIVVFYGLSGDLQKYDNKNIVTSYSSGTVTLNNGIKYSIQEHEGQNLHVLVMIEKDGQRFISQK